MVSFAEIAQRFLATAILLSGLAACSAPTSMYRWGIYEESIYQQYEASAGASPIELSARLAEDIERTQAEGRRVPPGAHAYLGYLFASQGEFSAARDQFVKEKLLFPESTIYMDRLLKSVEVAPQ